MKVLSYKPFKFVLVDDKRLFYVWNTSKCLEWLKLAKLACPPELEEALWTGHFFRCLALKCDMSCGELFAFFFVSLKNLAKKEKKTIELNPFVYSCPEFAALHICDKKEVNYYC